MIKARQKAGTAGRWWGLVHGMLLAALTTAIIAAGSAPVFAQNGPQGSTGSNKKPAPGTSTGTSTTISQTASGAQRKYELRVVLIDKHQDAKAQSATVSCLVIHELQNDNRQPYCIYHDGNNNKWFRDDETVSLQTGKPIQQISVNDGKALSPPKNQPVSSNISNWLKHHFRTLDAKFSDDLSNLLLKNLSPEFQSDQSAIESYFIVEETALLVDKDFNVPQGAEAVKKMHETVVDDDKKNNTEHGKGSSDDNIAQVCVRDFAAQLAKGTDSGESIRKTEQCPDWLWQSLTEMGYTYNQMRATLGQIQGQLINFELENKPFNEVLKHVEIIKENQKHQEYFFIGSAAGAVLIWASLFGALLHVKSSDRSALRSRNGDGHNHYEPRTASPGRRDATGEDSRAKADALHQQLQRTEDALEAERRDLAATKNRNDELEKQVSLLTSQQEALNPALQKVTREKDDAEQASRFLFGQLTRLDGSLGSIPSGVGWENMVNRVITQFLDYKDSLDDIFNAARGDVSNGDQLQFEKELKNLLSEARHPSNLGPLPPEDLVRRLAERLQDVAWSRQWFGELLRHPSDDKRLVDLTREAQDLIDRERDVKRQLETACEQLEMSMKRTIEERDAFIRSAEAFFTYLELPEDERPAQELYADWAKKLQVEREGGAHRSLRMALSSVRQDWQRTIDTLAATREDVVQALDVDDLPSVCDDLLRRLPDMPDKRLWGDGIYRGFHDAWMHRLLRAEQILDAYLPDVPEAAPLRDVIRETASAFRRAMRALGIEVAPVRIGAPPPNGIKEGYRLGARLAELPEVRQVLETWSHSSGRPVVDVRAFGYQEGARTSIAEVSLFNPADFRS